MTTSPASPPSASATQNSGVVTPTRALIAAAAYAAIFLVIQVASGVDYDEITESTGNVIGFVVLPVGLGVAAIGALAVRWGALPELLREPDRVRKPAFLAAIPAFVVLYGVAALATTPWDEWTGSLIALILLGTLLVGVGEELLFRGYVLVGARKHLNEIGAWFVSSAAFGLFHGLNIVTGQAVGTTVQQIVTAFVFGSTFYLVRRWSGTLLLPMALHALWDFSTFLHAGRGDADPGVATEDAVMSLPITFIVLLTVIGLMVVLRRNTTTPQPA